MSKNSISFVSSLLCVLLNLLAWSSATSQTILNGDFEQGRGHGWTEYSTGGYAEIGTANFFASTEITPEVASRSGSMMARLGGYSYEVNAIYQTVTLPNITPLYLRFYSQTRSANTSECAGLWVGATVYVIINGHIIDSTYLCQYNDLHSWTMYYVDMSAIAGQQATIAFKAAAANSVWSFVYFDDISIGTTTGVGENLLTRTPGMMELQQNYPNPFNPLTQITYTVGKPGLVSLTVYDLMGRELARLVRETRQVGTFQVVWNAETVPSGVYFYRLTTVEGTITRRMNLIR